jgi:hypothetical protein
MMSNSAHPEPPDIDERYKRSEEARFLTRPSIFYNCTHSLATCLRFCSVNFYCLFNFISPGFSFVLVI